MAQTVSTVPGFRRPWTQGARAYFEADTFAAAKEGFKRKRKDEIFHMPNTGEAGRYQCALCKVRLSMPAGAVNRKDGDVRLETQASTTRDRWSTWRYNAKTKKVYGGMHYACSWGDLMGQIAKLRVL